MFYFCHDNRSRKVTRCLSVYVPRNSLAAEPIWFSFTIYFKIFLSKQKLKIWRLHPPPLFYSSAPRGLCRLLLYFPGTFASHWQTEIHFLLLCNVKQIKSKCLITQFTVQLFKFDQVTFRWPSIAEQQDCWVGRTGFLRGMLPNIYVDLSDFKFTF